MALRLLLLPLPNPLPKRLFPLPFLLFPLLLLLLSVVPVAVASAAALVAVAALPPRATSSVWVGASRLVMEMFRSELTAAAFCSASSVPAAWFAAMATGRSALSISTCLSTFLSDAAVLMLAGVFLLAVVSTCCTAKQPPKGPARALLRHRTVQRFPVEPEEAGRVSRYRASFGI